MTDYGTIIFNAKPEYRAILYGGDGLFRCKYDEELYLSFDFQQDIPMFWNNHSIFDLQLGIPNNLLTREDGIRIQEVYDTKAFDYSILDLTYSEEQLFILSHVFCLSSIDRLLFLPFLLIERGV